MQVQNSINSLFILLHDTYHNSHSFTLTYVQIAGFPLLPPTDRQPPVLGLSAPPGARSKTIIEHLEDIKTDVLCSALVGKDKTDIIKLVDITVGNEMIQRECDKIMEKVKQQLQHIDDSGKAHDEVEKHVLDLYKKCLDLFEAVEKEYHKHTKSGFSVWGILWNIIGALLAALGIRTIADMSIDSLNGLGDSLGGLIGNSHESTEL
ncbi:Uu.00g022610.m01.CDS01 [Anthostomella pinea]|uniref:Uu.00g022610.m01.CDS01 n=1 Tax=Anthostomella pinea TaxID=933095 RepID=A0AAI8VZW2_9PEZI|nr:Uu.00g022610.m01.CDS01 [Anthostomella pinea]